MRSPGPDVTHLLLPVPSLGSDGHIPGAGSLWHLLADLPKEIWVIGGNLQHPVLEDYRKIDLLQDPTYIAGNAAITAECALRLAGTHLKIVFRNCPVLVIGWGRIGKCLARLLKNLDANVTVSARKESDLAVLRALGYEAVNTQDLGKHLQSFRLVFNTVPFPVITQQQAESFLPDCVRIDLASRQGIEGEGVIWARGLPAKYAPESSGDLIADTILRMLEERRLLP
ncbi:MAG: hypothetical protein ACI4PO_01250 [Faecousia sp.]